MPCRGPLDIPLLGQLIAQAVTHFAEMRGLQSDVWYQGEPLWFVWREVAEDQEPFVQEVQVAAFATAEGEQLFFIPQAYSTAGGQQKATPPLPTTIVQRPLKEFFPPLNEEATRAEVEMLLAEAWRVAETFKPINLTRLS